MEVFIWRSFIKGRPLGSCHATPRACSYYWSHGHPLQIVSCMQQILEHIMNGSCRGQRPESHRSGTCKEMHFLHTVTSAGPEQHLKYLIEIAKCCHQVRIHIETLHVLVAVWLYRSHLNTILRDLTYSYSQTLRERCCLRRSVVMRLLKQHFFFFYISWMMQSTAVRQVSIHTGAPVGEVDIMEHATALLRN